MALQRLCQGNNVVLLLSVFSSTIEMTSAVATSVASQSIPVLEVFIKSSTTRTAAFRLVDVYIDQQCVHVVVL